MKKRVVCSLLLLSLLTAILSGCGANKNQVPTRSHGNKTQTVSDVMQQGTGATATPTPAKLTDAPTPANPTDAVTPEGTPTPVATVTSAPRTFDKIDVDLTTLSSTMVYSEVYNMVVTPEDYIGKVVKMSGEFAYFHDDAIGADYFACIIADATACCQQGIEFVLAGSHSFPDDYPALGTNICVVGEFDTYEEAGYMYCTLRNATLQ